MDFAEIIDILYKEIERSEECNIAGELDKQLVSIPGFGCSDCRCESHLFYGSFEKIVQVTEGLQMMHYLVKNY